MRTAGIIAEFNPFHNGHKHLVGEVKKAGYSHIVAVMSSYAVQRGDIAIFDPISRAQAAVKNGVDLVLELPTQYALAPAKDFARAGVDILSRLGCLNALAFGSEAGEVEPIKKAAEAVKNVDSRAVKELMSQGLSYPLALSRLLPEQAKILRGANNTLAIEYINALDGTDIEPITVKRTALHDGSEASGKFASASMIRNMIFNGEDASPFMPECNAMPCKLSDAEKAMCFKICTLKREDVLKLPYGSGGLLERFWRLTRRFTGTSELVCNMATKNCTLAGARRALLHAVLGITSQDIFAPPYARVLALNEKGTEILRAAKMGSIALSTSLADLERLSPEAKRTAEITEAAARLQWITNGGVYSSPYSAKIAATKNR